MKVFQSRLAGIVPSTRFPHLVLAAAALAAVIVLAGCAQASPSPRVYFVAPREGAVTGSPLTVKMAADNFTVEAAGEVKAGHGHLHIMVDTPCVAAGQAIPKDDNHLHFGKGQTEAELTLAAGKHTLCLQAADGAHMALDGAALRSQITIEVQ